MIYYQGHVDLGDGVKHEKVAREALVVMAVGINSHWKLPIGYFFVNGLSATG